MKKLFQIGAFLCGVLMTQAGFADYTNNYSNSNGCNPCCQQQPECPPDQPCGDCYCLYAHYEPCYTNNWRCCEEPRWTQKKCCRWVPREYQVQRCRYVPQYYCETCTKYEPQYYCVDQCVTCKKWVCDRQCKYVPRYYYKRVCNQACNQGNTGCNSGCGNGGCGSNAGYNNGGNYVGGHGHAHR
ncbi:MAG: hypothetical protein Q8K75_02580 [Chlamydiales bacterium]|nr:hypothetical protein [Chlamydiales bacterium]